jgi:hypothetical protein
MVMDRGQQGLDANLAGSRMGHGLIAQAQHVNGLAEAGVNGTAHGVGPF